MMLHSTIGKQDLRFKIQSGEITLAGNSRLKIYGLLNCKSGKRMNRDNRIFFKNEKEAIRSGYRPCAHCQPIKYKTWNFLPRKGKTESKCKLVLRAAAGGL